MRKLTVFVPCEKHERYLAGCHECYRREGGIEPAAANQPSEVVKRAEQKFQIGLAKRYLLDEVIGLLRGSSNLQKSASGLEFVYAAKVLDALIDDVEKIRSSTDRSAENPMSPGEAFEIAAQVVEKHLLGYFEEASRLPEALVLAEELGPKIRELAGKPFRLMESAANIPLPDRLIRDRVAKAASDVMRARGWHLEAFACAFWKQTGAWDGSNFRLVERREVKGEIVETTWRFERIAAEPSEGAPAPEPECPT